jgi:hypothetical protein
VPDSTGLSDSGKAIHRVFASSGQEAFFEGQIGPFRRNHFIPVQDGPTTSDEAVTSIASS